ncbi:acyltransferase family protein [Salipiger mangrovisoli]|uniref:Acyltransferase n=1 Tax=Salipiger mangrovisoli TaxID=2865933 RepID=A0ABR9XA59_9RHOB|nr:acyltransferase family protein [Salipiger mangrovisoli]MBE9640364.1 acyltransferase [Salipiger mangrovisoli]
MRYRPDIDGLRTVAVVPVVLFHTGLAFPGGFVGVDVFFVISGFLITSLLLSELDEGKFSVAKFYERRARRLFPALFAMLAVTGAGATVFMTSFDLESFAKSSVATTVFAANIWFYSQQGYFTEAAELSPLLHTWSLGVEEQYYIFFPLILYGLMRWSSARVTLLLTALMSCASLAAAVYMLNVSAKAAFYLPQYRAWELLTGSLLAMGFWQKWSILQEMPARAAHLQGLAGLAAIVIPTLIYSAATPFPGLAALAPCLGAAALIASGGSGRTFSARFLSLPLMTFIGKLSYSLYLWHWPVVVYAFYRYGSLSTSTGILCLFISFVLAYLSYRFVETPVRSRKRFSERKVFLGSAAGMACFILAGLTLWKLDGLPSRMDPNLLAMSDSENFMHDRRDCHFMTAERAHAGDICVRGRDAETPGFVLVGDSHADAISPAIFGAAEDLGIAGYQFTDAGFAPLLGVRELGERDKGTMDAFVEFLDERPEINTVIIQNYWLHIVTGATYRHQGDVWLDAEYDGSLTDYNPKAVKRGLERLASRFPDRRFILLDDVPSGSDLHVREQLRHMKLDRTETLGLKSEINLEQRMIYEDLLKSLAEDVPNISYRPIYEDLCDDEVCHLFDGDVLLFRDGDHLSWKGALRLKPSAHELLSVLYPNSQSPRL